MSRKKRKVKKRPQSNIRPGRVVTPQQNTRLRQAIHAQTMGNFAFAEAEYRALSAEKIGVPQPYNNLAIICAQSSRPKEARNLWIKALEVDPRFVDARMHLANSYQQSGHTDKAIDCYRKVLSDYDRLVDARYLMANLLKNKGKFDESADCYKQVMRQQPDYTQAHFSYSQIHKYEDKNDPHISLMLDLIQKPDLKTENRVQLAFALAKALEDIGDHARAFQFLETGNGLRSAEFNYQIDGDTQLIESIMHAFSREAMSGIQVEPQNSNRPIFIIGMPRSGTSLVERILSSHSDVFAAGELDYIFALGTRLFLKQTDFQFAALDAYPRLAFETMARTYLDQIKLLDDKSHRVTDKMPFNMMMIGLIKIVLPNAKIIHCVRDAKDNCLSIFKQNFATGNYRFAYDLKVLGQFHNLYRRLMDHWHRVMPGAIYDISYESLTRNPEPEIRKLLSACDLDWQEDCLNFHSNKGDVKTASVYQVRQPIYTSSVSLWEHYQEYLQPLFEELDAGPV